MSGLGGLRGVSAGQDARFTDKQKKALKDLVKAGKVPKELELKVDLKKVNWPVMKEWIAKRVTQLLGGLEEEVLIGMVYNFLEDPEMNGKMLYVNLLPFLEKNTSLFCKELWLLLYSANQTASHIPQEMLDAEAERQRQQRQQQEAIQAELERRRIAQEAERTAQLLAVQQQISDRHGTGGNETGRAEGGGGVKSDAEGEDALPPPPPRGERRERRGWEPRDPEPSGQPHRERDRHRWEPRDMGPPQQAPQRRERRGWEPRDPEPDSRGWDRGRPSRWDSNRGGRDRERERDGRDKERASRWRSPERRHPVEQRRRSQEQDRDRGRDRPRDRRSRSPSVSRSRSRSPSLSRSASRSPSRSPFRRSSSHSPARRSRSRSPSQSRSRSRSAARRGRSRDRVGGRMRAQAKRSRSQTPSEEFQRRQQDASDSGQSPGRSPERHDKAGAPSPVRDAEPAEVRMDGKEAIAGRNGREKDREKVKKDKKEHKKEKKSKHKKEKKSKREKHEAAEGDGNGIRRKDSMRGGETDTGAAGSDGEPSDPELAELRAKALRSARSL